MGEGKVLCGSNSYTEKFYFNDELRSIPEPVKRELQMMCVSFTEQVGGTLMVSFTEQGELRLELGKDDADYLYDDIEAELAIRQLQKEKQELFLQLEEYYRSFVLRTVRAEAAARELEEFLLQEEREAAELEALMREEEEPFEEEDAEEEEDPIEYGEELYEDEMAERLAEEFEDPDAPAEQETEEISLDDYLGELLHHD